MAEANTINVDNIQRIRGNIKRQFVSLTRLIRKRDKSSSALRHSSAAPAEKVRCHGEKVLLQITRSNDCHVCGWRHVLSAGTTKVLCNRVCGIMTRNLAPLQSEEAKDKEEEQLWDEQSLHSILNWQTTLFSSCSCWVCDFPPGIYRLKFLNFLHHERTGIQFKCRVLRWLTSYHHRHVSYDAGDGPWVEGRII